MNQFGIGSFRPTPRGLIELVRKGAYRDRDGNPFGSKEGQLAFPIETSRRDRRIRQPIECDIVENVILRKAFTLTVKDACDECKTRGVVVAHPGSKADG